MDSSTNIIQWNLNGTNSQYEELKLLISEHQPEIICLQETHLKPSTIFKIKNYQIFRTDKITDNRACGGVLTAIHKRLVAKKINIDTPIQAVITIVNTNIKIHICNIYLPPTEPINEYELTQLINKLPQPHIILGDVNASHISWGNKFNNSRGNLIKRIQDNFDLLLLNTGTTTHLCPRTGSLTAIDITLCSPNLYNLFEWKVINDPHNSDHFPILTKMTGRSNNGKRHWLWAVNKAKWDIFQNKISLNYEDGNIAQINDYITQQLIEAAEASIPKSKPSCSNPKPPWFDNDCKEIIRKRNQALNKFRKCPCTENLINFKKLRAESRNLIRNKKKESWNSFVSNINTNTPIRTVWRKINAIRGKYSNEQPTLEIEGSIIYDPTILVERFAEHYAETSSSMHYNLQFRQKISQYQPIHFTINNNNNNNTYNLPITKWELDTAISTLKMSAAGPDHIHNSMIKNIPTEQRKHILHFFNRIWLEGELPEKWQESIVVPILKPGKDKLEVKNYRPVSLTSCLCKLLEKIINKRLLWYIEKNRLLSDFQCGQRKGKSTVDHLASLETEILNSFINKRECLGIFFDIEKAFDTVWRPVIVKQLYDWGFRGALPRFIQNFLNTRSIQVRIGEKLSRKTILENGIPQGSVLSGTLFLIAINSIKDALTHRSLKSFLFVDDLAILIQYTDTSRTIAIIQSALNKLQTWSHDNGLIFSTDKTKCVIFSRKKYPSPPPTITLYNKVLSFHNHCTFLGLTVDSKLTWKHHIMNLKESCLQRLNIMKVLAGTSWGADRSRLLQIYQCLIRSKLDYGSHIYASARFSLLSQLDTVHHNGIRLATGAFRTSPILSLCSESSLPPLTFRRHQLAINYISNLATQPTNPAFKYVFRPKYQQIYSNNPRKPAPLPIRYRRIIEEIEQKNIQNPYSCTPPWTYEKPRINMKLHKFRKKSTPTYTINNEFHKIKEKHKNATFIYTDGSKINDNIGSAIVTSEQSYKYKLPSHCSIFTAELAAISYALYNIMTKEGNEYIVCSDSLSALQSLLVLYSDHPVIIKIQEYLTSLKLLQKEVEFLWIPSHVGIKCNEIADRLAKEAALSNQDIVPVCVKTDVKKWVNLSNKAAWEDMWDDVGNNKLKEIKLSTNKWQTSVRASRREETAITRLRIGHSRLTHIYLITKDPQPKCNRCQTPITIKHIIEECPDYDNLMRKHNLHRSLQQSLSDCEEVITRLIKFLKESKLLNLL